MEISFNSKKLKKNCEDHKKLKASYGAIQSSRIIQRISELQAATNLYDISKLPQARLHSLVGDKKGQLAVDILHPYRIILLPLDGNTEDLKTITSIEIVSIIDYH